MIFSFSLRHTPDFRNHKGEKGLFSKFHISVVFCPKIFGISAFESPGPIFCIFEACEHLRASTSTSRASTAQWNSTAYKKCYPKYHFLNNFRMFPQMLRKCSKNEKMQTLDPKLCNAPIPMCFWWIFIKITYLRLHHIFNNFFHF